MQIEEELMITGSQTLRVREWLEDGKSLTSKEAWERWGITRLSAIIHRLRRKGYVIETEDEWRYNRFGEKVRFGRYKLKETSNER